MTQYRAAWNNGTGYITINYNGEGNETVSVSSDENNLYDERQQIVRFKTTNNAIERELLVKQSPKLPNFKTADGLFIITADNHYLNAKE